MYTETTLPDSSSPSGATLTYHHQEEPGASPDRIPEKSAAAADEKDNDTKTTAQLQ